MNATAAASLADPYWTMLKDLWTRTMPARSLDEFASGDCPPLMVMIDGRGATLVDVGTGGRHRHASPEAAKDAADAIAKDLMASRNERMLAEADLAPDEWRFCNQDRFIWFQAIDDSDIRIERHGPRQWVAMRGTVALGFDVTPLGAASVHARISGPFQGGKGA